MPVNRASQVVRVNSLTNSAYLLLAVDKASKNSFLFPLPSKQAKGVAHQLLQSYSGWGVPRLTRCDGAQKSGAIVIPLLRPLLKADILLEPAGHPRDQETVERLGASIKDMLLELSPF